MITSVGMAITPTISASGTATTSESSGEDFLQTLGAVARSTVQSLKGAEKVAIDAIRGNANIQDVVQQTMTAEQNLQTALAVRDKAVAALQEIGRMTI